MSLKFSQRYYLKRTLLPFAYGLVMGLFIAYAAVEGIDYYFDQQTSNFKPIIFSNVIPEPEDIQSLVKYRPRLPPDEPDVVSQPAKIDDYYCNNEYKNCAKDIE